MNVEVEICTHDGFGFGHKEWLKKPSKAFARTLGDDIPEAWFPRITSKSRIGL